MNESGIGGGLMMLIQLILEKLICFSLRYTTSCLFDRVVKKVGAYVFFFSIPLIYVVSHSCNNNQGEHRNSLCVCSFAEGKQTMRMDENQGYN